MDTHLKTIFSRYKIEALLAFFAVFIFFTIIKQFIESQWHDPLRTMCFVLFGNLGLIGLSLGFKRHEQSLKEHADLNEERQQDKENKKVSRMHECIQKIDNNTPFAVFVGILAEIESFFQSLDDKKKEFVLKVLSTYIQSIRLKSVGGVPSNSADYISKDEAIRDQQKKINLTFALLHKLTNGKPISTLDKFKIEKTINLSGLELEGEDASLDGESFVNCSLGTIRFSNTSITNSTFSDVSLDFQKQFRNVRVDGTDFSYGLEKQLTEFYSHNQHDLNNIKQYFHYKAKAPKSLVQGLVQDQEIERKLLKAMKK